MIAVCTTMILVGYSSYASMTIRAAANPPMNSNNPATPYNLLSVLNRDQYGNRPLLWGPYYSAVPIDMVDQNGDPTGEYEYKITQYLNPETGKYEPREIFTGYKYHSGFMHFFPRMWNPQRNSGYEDGWVELQEVATQDDYGHDKTIEVPMREVPYTIDTQNGKRDLVGYEPTRGEDIRFFFGYQMGDMFWRYFMWNFVGRQDDIQLEKDENGTYIHGGWLSGITPIDELFCGPQSDLPDEMASNRARNTYFFLPFLLGLIGLIYHLNRDPRYFIVVMWLFVMMGIALVVYFNISPNEVRERDYVYAGAFYAFAMWIGIGVMAVGELLSKIVRRSASSQRAATAAAATAVLLSSSVPAILAAENWDDHDRSGRTMARDIGWNYLNSAPEGAIVVNYGDNDTFPLWFNQEVDGVRTDVRVMNSSYLAGEWYIDEMKLAANDAAGVKFSLPASKYSYVNDYVMVEQPGDAIYARQLDSLYGQLRDIETRYSMSTNDLEAGRLEAQYNATVYRYYDVSAKADSINKMRLPMNVADAIRLVATDTDEMTAVRNNGTMRLLGREEAIPAGERGEDYAVMGLMPAKLKSPIDGKMSDYIPTSNLFIEVDREKAIASGTVKERDSSLVVDRVNMRLGSRALQKDQLMMLDLFANFGWQRPLSFTQSHLLQDYGLLDYAQFDGYSYRLVPIRTPARSASDIGRIDIDYVYPLLAGGYDDPGEEAARGAVNAPFRYGNLADPDVYVDYFFQYNLSASRTREGFARVAKALISRGGEGDLERAERLLQRGMELLPPSQVRYTMSNTKGYVEAYYQLGAWHLDRSTELMQQAVGEMQRLTGDTTAVGFNDYDQFSYRYDLADLYARLINSAQRTMTAGELAQVRAVVAQSDDEYMAAEEAFSEGDRIMAGYIRNSAQYARYYMQFMTDDRFTLKVSNILYNCIADIIEMFDYSQQLGGSLDRHIVPLVGLLSEYVKRVDGITPRSVNDPKMILVLHHIDNMLKLSDYFYTMSQQSPSADGGITSQNIDDFTDLLSLSENYLLRDEVQTIFRIMNEEGANE